MQELFHTYTRLVQTNFWPFSSSSQAENPDFIEQNWTPEKSATRDFLNQKSKLGTLNPKEQIL
jgi:hypothetical protein